MTLLALGKFEIFSHVVTHNVTKMSTCWLSQQYRIKKNVNDKMIYTLLPVDCKGRNTSAQPLDI